MIDSVISRWFSNLACKINTIGFGKFRPIFKVSSENLICILKIRRFLAIRKNTRKNTKNNLICSLIYERNLSVTGAQWYVLYCIVEEWKKLFLKTQPQGTSNHFEEYRGKIESNYRNACFQKNAFKFVIFAISRDILKIFPRKNLTMGLFSRRYIGTSQILKLCNKIIG